ncbi:MAG: C-GCAxxG-C-C family protein [Bacteroidales bacterium]|jgi:C_GCAxxG_C_C family probable redox protein|nr:C-GCAxxG-C-C family protein [Bacteroidales bacterium]
MRHPNEAVNLYSKNFNCCQSILGSFGPDFDLNMEMVLKLGAGLSGGLAFHGETCGAVIGACIILGLVNGSNDPSNDLAEQTTYISVKEFLSDFKKKFGTTGCNKLFNTDVSTPEGFELAQESSNTEIKNLNENCCANSTTTTDMAKITIFLSHARKG